MGARRLRLSFLGRPRLPPRTPPPRLPTPDQTEVSSVIVTARLNPEDPPVVATARKRLSETPGAVSVISQESYINRQTLALDCDMLRDAPGVYAQRKWGGDIRISIRGSGIGNANHNRGLLIAQDGVPL
ncbi:TonB-dependent receptor plug domain-containing protein [Caulobacter segnis]